ncbi:MAG TPA: L,D-transpeptidase family protein, partial [Flavobacteriales bacterium]|nr:L,D-transpeptidase family protein [Flavobacteriales bacterium]
NYTSSMYRPILIKFITIISLFLIAMTVPAPLPFRIEQKKHARVKAAYSEKESSVKTLFKAKGVSYSGFSMILVGFKAEQKFKVYVRGAKQKSYSLLKSYDICASSGALGPKRREGDLQVPEGLYEVSSFNPQSSYHLSIKVSYPNKSDKVLSDKKKPGGDIYIHGNCVSIGCIPLTDALIKEIYIMAVETRNAGHKIPVYIFPFEMTPENMAVYKMNDGYKKHHLFWDNLQKMYTYWSKNKNEIPYTVDAKGRYVLR